MSLVMLVTSLLAAASGLTALSQSVGILFSYGAANQIAVGATSLMTGMIAAARLSGGVDGRQVHLVSSHDGGTRLVADRCSSVERVAKPGHRRDQPDDGRDGL